MRSKRLALLPPEGRLLTELISYLAMNAPVLVNCVHVNLKLKTDTHILVWGGSNIDYPCWVTPTHTVLIPGWLKLSGLWHRLAAFPDLWFCLIPACRFLAWFLFHSSVQIPRPCRSRVFSKNFQGSLQTTVPRPNFCPRAGNSPVVHGVGREGVPLLNEIDHWCHLCDEFLIPFSLFLL